MEPTPETPDTGAEIPRSSMPDILAVIESAKARGGIEGLQKWLHKRFPESTDEQVNETAELALEIIESVPVFIASARQEADERNLASVVYPLLAHAERYYLQPVDLIPEMTQGLAGLLDDSYLVIRILENLEKGPEHFLEWDFDYPRQFLASIMGSGISQRLDLIAIEAMQQVSAQLSEFWSQMSHPA